MTAPRSQITSTRTSNRAA